MKDIEKMLLVAYIAVMTGMAISMVGRTPSNCEAFTGWVPVQMLLVMGVPAVLAYIAGRKSATP